METTYYLGIDMAKNSFQAALTLNGVDMAECSVENTSEGIKSYFQDLKKKLDLSQLVVCVEHSGIYTYRLLSYLTKNKIKVCVESALQIQRSQGVKRGKSDQIDARRIAQYAYKNAQDLRIWAPPRKVLETIKSLLAARNRMIQAKVLLTVPIQEQESIDVAQGKLIKQACKAPIASLEAKIKKVEKEILLLVKSDQSLKEQMAYATSVPGIGPITALNMIIYTGEFERISESKKFACYAGVAPFEHSSGTSIRGKTRVSKLANMNMKKLLHMAAMASITCSKELREFYDRKVTEGKNKMSVLNAVRNKLISRVFACVKNKRLYEKAYLHSIA
jgi:transposase